MRIKSVTLPEILLYIGCSSLVKHTTAHCGNEFTPIHTPTVTFNSYIPKNAPLSGYFYPSRKEDCTRRSRGRNVTLAVNCTPEDAILTWSNGGIPYLQEVTIYSSCIDPTNTSLGAVTDVIHWAFFGASSELDAKQATVEAFLGKQCSYYGCYERQARARFYTFSTVSCAWTEPAGLDLVPSTSYLPAPSSHLVMLSSAALTTSNFSPSPTPSVAALVPSSSYLPAPSSHLAMLSSTALTTSNFSPSLTPSVAALVPSTSYLPAPSSHLVMLSSTALTTSNFSPSLTPSVAALVPSSSHLPAPSSHLAMLSSTALTTSNFSPSLTPSVAALVPSSSYLPAPSSHLAMLSSTALTTSNFSPSLTPSVAALVPSTSYLPAPCSHLVMLSSAALTTSNFSPSLTPSVAALVPSSSYLPAPSSHLAMLSSTALTTSNFSPSLTPSVAALVPSSSYLPAPCSHLVMLSSAALTTSNFSPSPTPSVASYHSITSGGAVVVPLITSPVVVGSTVFPVGTPLSHNTGVSPPVYVWVVPVVLIVFIITAVTALSATCYISAHKYDNSLPLHKYAVVKGIFSKEEKIDLDFYPVSTCTPTETLSIHSDITVYNWLQSTCKKDGGCEAGVDGLELNQEECIKEAAKYAEPSSFRLNAISQSLATSDSVEKSNRRLKTSTQSQSTASSPTESVRTIKVEVPTISTQSGMRKTPLGYVLEEDVQTVNHMHTVIANLEKEQTKEDM